MEVRGKSLQPELGYHKEIKGVVSSQYWNSVHGYTPDDVRRHKEGLVIKPTELKNPVSHPKDLP